LDRVENVSSNDNGIAAELGRDCRNLAQDVELIVGVPGLRVSLEESTSHPELKIRSV
jgi:hypothetical protein